MGSFCFSLTVLYAVCIEFRVPTPTHITSSVCVCVVQTTYTVSNFSDKERCGDRTGVSTPLEEQRYVNTSTNDEDCLFGSWQLWCV